MQQTWNIRSRAHHCALSNRPFEEGEKHYTAIYFDTKSGEFTRRDIAVEAWAQELTERTPFSHWKTIYEKTVTEAKPEITPKESALSLLQRLIEEDNAHTENARYILAAMLERKRILSPTATKENDEGHKLLFYENKKTGDVFVIRDPELRLDELASVQEEVATLLGFGGPAAEAAKVAGVKLGPDGKVLPKDSPTPAPEQPTPAEAATASAPVEAVPQDEQPAGADSDTGTDPQEEPEDDATDSKDEEGDEEGEEEDFDDDDDEDEDLEEELDEDEDADEDEEDADDLEEELDEDEDSEDEDLDEDEEDDLDENDNSEDDGDLEAEEEDDDIDSDEDTDEDPDEVDDEIDDEEDEGDPDEEEEGEDVMLIEEEDDEASR